MTELEYAEAWAASARAEGHRKRLPQVNGCTSDAHMKVYDVLKDGGMTNKQIADKIERSVSIVNVYLRKLETENKVEKVGDKWRIK